VSGVWYRLAFALPVAAAVALSPACRKSERDKEADRAPAAAETAPPAAAPATEPTEAARSVEQPFLTLERVRAYAALLEDGDGNPFDLVLAADGRLRPRYLEVEDANRLQRDFLARHRLTLEEYRAIRLRVHIGERLLAPDPAATARRGDGPPPPLHPRDRELLEREWERIEAARAAQRERQAAPR
jgi:hypothetical protein